MGDLIQLRGTEGSLYGTNLPSGEREVEKEGEGRGGGGGKIL